MLKLQSVSKTFGKGTVNEKKALGYLAWGKWVTTSVNSVLSIIFASALYLAIRKRLPNYFKQ